jgi:hypothetical protein
MLQLQYVFLHSAALSGAGSRSELKKYNNGVAIQTAVASRRLH